MDIDRYFESLSHEVNAIKDRVRYLIADAHWQTDGEWKESVIRQILRRHLPATAVVGRGFVVSADAYSHQIDVLIRNSSIPVLFSDGDLSFVTPDAVWGIIEVKSRATHTNIREAAVKLSRDIGIVRGSGNSRAFAAIYAFDVGRGRSSNYLESIVAAAKVWDQRVDFAALGPSRFIRYWNEDPETQQLPYRSWHSYSVPGRATGYFVHNVVDAISPLSVHYNRRVWYPALGKEPHRTDVRRALFP